MIRVKPPFAGRKDPRSILGVVDHFGRIEDLFGHEFRVPDVAHPSFMILVCICGMK